MTGRQIAARGKIRGMKLEPHLLELLIRVSAGNSFEVCDIKWDVQLKELEILQLIVEERYTDHRYTKWSLLDAGQAMIDREQGKYDESKVPVQEPPQRMVVLEIEDDPNDRPYAERVVDPDDQLYSERVIATIDDDGGLDISHQFLDDKREWRSWQDSGVYISKDGVDVLRDFLEKQS